MTSCEKCWRDAGGDAERYRELIAERSGDMECSYEDQAGGDAAGTCPHCKRQAVHHICNRCMNRDCTHCNIDQQA